MRFLLPSIICLIAFSFGCTPTEQGDETRQFLDACQKQGIQGELKGGDNVCRIEIDPQTNLTKIPKSGSIKLNIGLEDRSVQAQMVRDLCQSRKVGSLRLNKCRISPAAIEEIKRIQLHGLSVSNSTYLDEASPKIHGKRSSIYELQIENCDSKLADSVLERIGIMTRTLIEMPKSYSLKVGFLDNVEKFGVRGCSLAIEKEFERNDKLMELTIYDTKLHATDISYFLRLKGLYLLSIFKYEIDESEWAKIEIPLKASERLTVVTDGRLAEFLDKKLGNQIQIR